MVQLMLYMHGAHYDALCGALAATCFPTQANLTGVPSTILTPQKQQPPSTLLGPPQLRTSATSGLAWMRCQM